MILVNNEQKANTLKTCGRLHFYNNNVKDANFFSDKLYKLTENEKKSKNMEEKIREKEKKLTDDEKKLGFTSEVLVTNNIYAYPHFKIIEVLSDKFDAKEAIQSNKTKK